MTIMKFVCTLLLSLIFSTTAFAQAVQGVFMVVKGDIKVTTGAGKSDTAKVGTKVGPGDTVVSGADSRAKIVMADKNVINISPDSKIVIEKYENDGKDKKSVELKVEYGKLRASVEQKYDGEKSKFNIKTPTAVAGVRGTDFMTGFNKVNRTSQVVTFSGTVAFGTPGPGGTIQNPVFVQQGQMTTAVGEKPPGAPQPVPKEELNKMNNESKADSAKNQPNQEPDKKVADKKDDKKDEKKDDSKNDQADNRDNKDKQDNKKDDSKKDQADNRDNKDKQDNKKDDSNKKREPASTDGDSSGKKEPKNSNGTDNKNDSKNQKGPGTAGPGNGEQRNPANAQTGGMVNMNDMPTAPGGGAMPNLQNSGPVIPVMLPPTLNNNLPQPILTPINTGGKSNVNIIINR